MELNETLQKVDQTLDSTVKKVEKQAREMSGKDLVVELLAGKQGTPFITDFFLQSMLRSTWGSSNGMTASTREPDLSLKLQAWSPM